MTTITWMESVDATTKRFGQSTIAYIEIELKELKQTSKVSTYQA